MNLFQIKKLSVKFYFINYFDHFKTKMEDITYNINQLKESLKKNNIFKGNNEKFLEKYHMEMIEGNVLGKGTFGIVYKAINKETKNEVAIKVIP